MRLEKIWHNWLGLAGRRSIALAVVAWFALSNGALLALLRPWSQLEWSTWFCGYEAGRIARNMLGGHGYSSPFYVFPGDNFSDTLPIPPLTPDHELLPAMPPPSGSAPGGPDAVSARPGPPPTAWITPPYVFLFYAVFKCFGTYSAASVVVIYLLQTAFMAAAIFGIWSLLMRVAGVRAAAVLLPIAVLYPPFWYFSIRDAHGTTLFICLTVLSLNCLARFLQSGGCRWLWGHAAFAVVAVLAEPASILAYVFLELLATWRLVPAAGWKAPRSWIRPGDRRGAARLWLALGVMAALVLGPWWLRNAVVFDRFIPLKSNLPMELYYGNNPEAETDMVAAHFSRLPTASHPERVLLHRLGETAFADLCRVRFMAYMKERPVAFMRMSLQRVIYFWSYNPFKKNPWRPALDILFHLLLALGLFGWLLPRRPALSWLDAACLGFLLLYPLAFYASHFLIYRYRLPVEVILLIWVSLRAETLARLWEGGDGPVQSGRDSGAAAVRETHPAHAAKQIGTM